MNGVTVYFKEILSSNELRGKHCKPLMKTFFRHGVVNGSIGDGSLTDRLQICKDAAVDVVDARLLSGATRAPRAGSRRPRPAG